MFLGPYLLLKTSFIMDLPKRVKHPEAKIESKKIVETFTKLGRITFLYFRINVNLRIQDSSHCKQHRSRSCASELQLKVNCRSERYAEKNLVWLLVGRPAKMTRRK